MRKQKNKCCLLGMTAFLFFSGLMATPAWAIPALQLYIEGATYDSFTETWVVTTADPFKLWVVGDVSHYGSILDVKLSAAVSTSELPGSSITLTSTTTSLVTDPSTPSPPSPTGSFPSSDGAVPVLGDGSSLPTHGIYGPGTSFYEWTLGDFTLTDSPIGDIINSFPVSFPDTGQINVYTVTVSGFTQVHFDAYDHIFVGTHSQYKFAPFSHDAEGTSVPEPSSLLLLGSGLVGLGLWGRKRFKYGKD